MNIFSAATRAVAKTADATTAAAGAIGGAAVSGVVGGLRGAASGVRTGLDDGSHSTAAAALTLGAIGAAGLVEWPVLLTVGGAALLVHQLNQRSAAGQRREPPLLSAVARTTDGDAPTGGPATASPRKASPRKASPRKATPRKATKTTARKSGTTASRRGAGK